MSDRSEESEPGRDTVKDAGAATPVINWSSPPTSVNQHGLLLRCDG